MRVGDHSEISTRWWHRAAALALLALFLVPINYRAGAAKPHGHALLQLIAEASAGIPAHHHSVDATDVHHRTGDVATSHSGAPSLQVYATSALLPMMLLVVVLWTLRSPIRQISDARPADLTIAPGHPPPDCASSPIDAP